MMGNHRASPAIRAVRRKGSRASSKLRGMVSKIRGTVPQRKGRDRMAGKASPAHKPPVRGRGRKTPMAPGNPVRVAGHNRPGRVASPTPIRRDRAISRPINQALTLPVAPVPVRMVMHANPARTGRKITAPVSSRLRGAAPNRASSREAAHKIRLEGSNQAVASNRRKDRKRANLRAILRGRASQVDRVSHQAGNRGCRSRGLVAQQPRMAVVNKVANPEDKARKAVPSPTKPEQAAVQVRDNSRPAAHKDRT
ncbi:MAG: hypothetical protein Alpg2KO_25620 [Alphaproteobacteria bacterium]